MQYHIHTILIHDEISTPSFVEEALLQSSTITLVESITYPSHLLAYIQAVYVELVIIETDQISVEFLWQLKQVHLHLPAVQFLVCLTNPVSHDMWGLLDAGVTGYVHHDDIPNGLWDAIESIQRGAIWYSPSMVPLIQEWSNTQPGPHTTIPSPSEVAIVTRVAQGQTNRQIAQTLKVNERTIRSRLEQLYRRWGVGNRTQAAMFAQEHGWIDEEMQELSWG